MRVMVDADDTRLGALLDQLQRMREADPTARVEDLRAEAGPLYDELVELVACVDCMRDTGISPPTPELSSSPPGRRRLRFVAGAALALLVGLAGVWATRARHDEIPARVAKEGRHATPFFVPQDPFDHAALAKMARDHGLRFVPLPATVPTPTATDSPAPRAGQVMDPRVVELERARLPASVRGTVAARYLLAIRLLRIGQDEAALELALALVSEHPDRRPPLAVALHALAGLGRVDTAQYAALHTRYLGSSDASAR